MRMNLKAALTASALVGMGFVAACADTATAPASGKVISEMNLALGVTTNSTPEFGKFKICKTGNAGGSFDVTRTAVGASTGVVSGLNTAIANGTCYVVAEDAGGTGVGSQVSFTEDAAANTVSSITACSRIDATAGNPITACTFNPDETVADPRFLNIFHGYVITVNNTFTPPPTGCTYTKGWYRNNGESTITLTLDGRTPAQQRAIFDATPGKPGSVTWQGDNNTLNLYQQLLAALNNLGGNLTAGPAAVDAAVAAALAGTGGTGLNITLVSGTNVSGLIATLSAFNEGTFTGWPHCDD